MQNKDSMGIISYSISHSHLDGEGAASNVYKIEQLKVQYSTGVSFTMSISKSSHDSDTN